MRYLVGFVCALVLGTMPVVGCGNDCTEQDVLDAIAEGGGPHTFACDGPWTITTTATIIIDNDVILDGEGNLTLDGARDHRVFYVPRGVKAELRGLTVTQGYSWPGLGGGGIANEGSLVIDHCVISDNHKELDIDSAACGGGIRNAGEMQLVSSTVTGNSTNHGGGGGICNAGDATLTLTNSTVSDNYAGVDGWGGVGGGILNAGDMTLVNSTVSGNVADGFERISGGGILNSGRISLIDSTIFGNRADLGDAITSVWWRDSRPAPQVEIERTLIGGECHSESEDGSDMTWLSNGYNIESPGETCRFDQETDQVEQTAEQLNLGPLADNGGPTPTHKPGDGGFGDGSAAIDQIPESDCDVDTDQRGEPRPETGGTMCDVGSVEVQP